MSCRYLDTVGNDNYCTKYRNRPSDYTVQNCCRYANGHNNCSCFLTTTMCFILGKPDDCYELETLRRFRQDVLLPISEGRELVDEYSRIAPPIATKLMSLNNNIEIADTMLKNYISPILKSIELGESSKDIIGKYKQMVFYVNDL